MESGEWTVTPTTWAIVGRDEEGNPIASAGGSIAGMTLNTVRLAIGAGGTGFNVSAMLNPIGGLPASSLQQGVFPLGGFSNKNVTVKALV